MGKTAMTRAPSGDLGVESFGREARPTRLQLPPSDIADLRYVFCELLAEAGVRSAHGRMCEEAAKTLRSRLKVPREPTVAKRTAKGKRAASKLTVAALSAIMGEQFDPERDTGRVEVEKATPTLGAIAVVIDEPTPKRSPLRKPPVLGGLIEDARARFILHGDDPRPATQLVQIGDGRMVRVWSGIAPRTLPKVGGRTIWMLPCKGDGESADQSLLGLEAWAEFAKTKRHVRGWRCRETLERMRLGGGMRHVVVLHAAYGPASPCARYDLWAKELAPLVEGTPTAIAARAELAHHRGAAARARHAAWEAVRGARDTSAAAHLRGLRWPTEDASVTVADAVRIRVAGAHKGSTPREQYDEACAERKAFIEQVRQEANAILIAACSAYRAAKAAAS